MQVSTTSKYILAGKEVPANVRFFSLCAFVDVLRGTEMHLVKKQLRSANWLQNILQEMLNSYFK